jgi:zinc protease
VSLAPDRVVLPNGAVCLAKRSDATPAVAIHLTVRAGSMCDPPDKTGAVWLLSRLLDRGTASRSAGEIAEALDSRGISLSIGVTRHFVFVTCTCLADDFEPVLTLLGDLLMHPVFPVEEIATRKGEIVTSIRQDDDNPAVRATEALMERLYPAGHAYGRKTKGTIETVERLAREDLVALHAHWFAPAGLTAVVVGAVDPGHAVAAASRTFGAWTNPVPSPMPLASPVPPEARQRIVMPMMNKAQADIAYGFTTIRRSDPAYDAYRLMNNILGQYSLGGRLGASIRERQGMAYYVHSVLDASIIEGPLTIRAGVAAGNVDRAVRSIDQELSSLAADGVTPKELEDSKRFLVGSLPRALETNAGIAAFLQQVEFFGLGLDYDANAAAARTLDPARATVVIAGPYRE